MKGQAHPGKERTSPTEKRFSGLPWLRLLCGLVIAAGVLIISAWFGSEVFEGETLAFDLSVRESIHTIASPQMTEAMIGLSFIGSPVFLFVLGGLAVIVFLVLKWKHETRLFLVTMAGELLLDLVLKNAYTRARPEAYFGYVLPSSYSFPSGHAFGSFCFFGILALLVSAHVQNPAIVWVIRVVAAALVLSIGFSRVYLGVHYPTDVLAGYLAGCIWLSTVILTDTYLRRRTDGRDQTP